MTTTNYPNGLSSFGVPTMGMNGLPLVTGNVYFVDAVNGGDGQDGSASAPLASLVEAYARMVDGHNDVAVIVGDGSTAATQRLATTLTWAKDACHIVGMTAPSMIAPRARISTVAGATTNVANLVNVTAQGCIFANFSLFQGVGQSATAEKLWQEDGQRNYYYRVGFGGMGGVAGAAHADSYSLKLYGAQENLFEECYFGTDTRDRDAANTNIQIRKNASNTASTRNVFKNCIISMRATDTDPTFVDANEAGSLDRFALFSGCTFINSGTSSLAAAVAGKTDQGGKLILDNCSYVGVTEIGNLSNNAAILVTGAVPNGNTSGVAVNANPS